MDAASSTTKHISIQELGRKKKHTMQQAQETLFTSWWGQVRWAWRPAATAHLLASAYNAHDSVTVHFTRKKNPLLERFGMSHLDCYSEFALLLEDCQGWLGTESKGVGIEHVLPLEHILPLELFWAHGSTQQVGLRKKEKKVYFSKRTQNTYSPRMTANSEATWESWGTWEIVAVGAPLPVRAVSCKWQ